jgi:hypothetical protein
MKEGEAALDPMLLDADVSDGACCQVVKEVARVWSSASIHHHPHMNRSDKQ